MSNQGKFLMSLFAMQSKVSFGGQAVVSIAENLKPHLKKYETGTGRAPKELTVKTFLLACTATQVARVNKTISDIQQTINLNDDALNEELANIMGKMEAFNKFFANYVTTKMTISGVIQPLGFWCFSTRWQRLLGDMDNATFLKNKASEASILAQKLLSENKKSEYANKMWNSVYGCPAGKESEPVIFYDKVVNGQMTKNVETPVIIPLFEEAWTLKAYFEKAIFPYYGDYGFDSKENFRYNFYLMSLSTSLMKATELKRLSDGKMKTYFTTIYRTFLWYKNNTMVSELSGIDQYAARDYSIKYLRSVRQFGKYDALQAQKEADAICNEVDAHMKTFNPGYQTNASTSSNQTLRTTN